MAGANYVNVYEVTRHYGGPEEGGWWYNRGEPITSILLFEDDPEANALILEFARKRYSPLSEGDIYSVRGGVQINVVVEDHFATPWPAARPHYE